MNKIEFLTYDDKSSIFSLETLKKLPHVVLLSSVDTHNLKISQKICTVCAETDSES